MFVYKKGSINFLNFKNNYIGKYLLIFINNKYVTNDMCHKQLVVENVLSLESYYLLNRLI